MVERARRSVGATIAASRTALEMGCGANLAGGTHHAFSDRGEGYCVFNDVAVAARALQRDGRITRVAIVDCDVHQGNGTAAIFAGEPTVFTFSMHGAKNYPFRKEASDLDIELPDRTGDELYLAHLSHSLDMVLAIHQPELIFYLAGADPYHGDRLGRLSLTIAGLRRRDEIVLRNCRAAGLPVVVTMSGGYAADVDDIVTIHANTIRVAIECAQNNSDLAASAGAGGKCGILDRPIDAGNKDYPQMSQMTQMLEALDGGSRAAAAGRGERSADPEQ